MKTRAILPVLTIAALALAGCSQGGNDDSSSNSSSGSSSGASAPQTYDAPSDATTPENNEPWSTDEGGYAEANGGKMKVNFHADPTPSMQQAIDSTNGALNPSVIAVEVDNTNGSEEIDGYDVQIVGEDGSTTKVKTANDWAVDKGNKIGDGELQGNDDAFTAVYDEDQDSSALPGAKSTQYFLVDQPLPEKVRNVTIEGTTFSFTAQVVPTSKKDDYAKMQSDHPGA